MGTYYIPRNLRGETRIFYIFTVKSLITTGIGALIGAIFFFIIGTILGEKLVGGIIMGIFALIGWAIGAIKIPTLAGLPFTKNIGGESLDEILKRYVKFKMNRRLYTYVDVKETTEETGKSTKEEK